MSEECTHKSGTIWAEGHHEYCAGCKTLMVAIENERLREQVARLGEAWENECAVVWRLKAENDRMKCCGNCVWFNAGTPTEKGECTNHEEFDIMESSVVAADHKCDHWEGGSK